MQQDAENRPVPELTANLGRLTLFLLVLAGVLTALELGLQAQRYVRDRIKGDLPPPPSYFAAYPGREDDVREYYRAEVANGWGPIRYVPFIEWTRAPFASRLLNIGPDGVRRTCFNSDDPRAKRVWVFGGSTVWGTGSPDCETLPSHLSQLLNMSGPHIVTNYGEGGYVSTQALIRFLTLLRNGDRPDVAIFYGGFNDVWTAIYARAGTHQDEPRMRAALEASHWQRAVAGFRTVIDRDYLTLYYSLRLFGVRAGEPQDSWIPATEADSAGEVVKAVDLYLENTRITEALANSYGIEVHSYWQPNVADKTPLSDVEAAQVKTLAPVLVSAFQSAGRIIDERGVSYGVVNLQRALRDAPRTLFTDYAHISGSGNRVIASRIARDIQALPAGQR